MDMTRRGWLLCLLAAACGAGTRNSKKDDPPHLTILLYNLGPEGKALTPVPPGGPLRSGDRYAVRVEVDRPAYLHLWQRSGAQAPAPLLRQPLPLAPQRALHLPEEGQEFALDQTGGDEQVLVLVAPAPLTEAQQRAALDLEPSRATRGGRGDPPPEMSERGRGDPNAVRVLLRGDRPTLARFLFRHL